MLKEYFSLSQLERNGIYALLFLCVLVLGVMRFWKYSYEPPLVDMSALQDSVDRFYASPRPIVQEESKPSFKSEIEIVKEKSLEVEHPLLVYEINTASYNELIQVQGIGDYFAKEIIKERNRLGGFSSYEQLLSIYNMSLEKIERLKMQLTLDSFIRMPRILLNTCDSVALLEISTIDTYCASSIVRYRERLGGFYATEQLLELSSIDEVRYSDILLRIELDTILLRKLDINNADFKTIMKHPYIDGYDNAKAIFRYLDFDEINSFEEFIKIPKLQIFNAEGLKHYLDFFPKKMKADTISNVQ